MDFQFFPTPQKLALAVWSKFKDPIKLVLEPSAGKGDLVDARINGFPQVSDSEYRQYAKDPEAFDRRGWREQGQIEWHACEINPQLHPMLTSKKAQIVGYDFLDMQSAAQYSTIVMNPPFADGARHLLHAWDIAYGAEICCILNAETVRNPYTKERERLAQLITQHGTVQYMADQFLGEGVERQTGVEIAIVYLKKVPSTIIDMDKILDSLKPAQEVHIEQAAAQTLNALALPIDFIDRVVEDYELASQAAIASAQASAVLAVAEARLGFTFDEMQSKGMSAQDRPTKVEPAEIIRHTIKVHHDDLRNRAWGQILRSTKLLEKLSVAGRKNVESQFETISKLEFSRTNIHGFFAGLLQSMGDIHTQMILDLYDTILGRDTDNCVFYQSWKSNDKHKTLGMRIKRTRFILPLAQYDYSSQRSASYNTVSVLSDMDKVFRLLDPEQKEHGFGLVDLVQNPVHYQNLIDGQRLDTEYLSVRFYKGKGTYHFFPRNVEVIERLNRFVGKARQWLPPEMGMASDDFVKQYEQAEKLHPQYQEAIKKSHVMRYTGSPVYLLLKAKNEDKENSALIDTLCSAVAQTQRDNGIFFDASLEGGKPEQGGQLEPQQTAMDTQQQQLQLTM